MKTSAALLSIFLALGKVPFAGATPVVAVDPGHGGGDRGLTVSGAEEKDWNLRFAQALVKALQKEGLGAIRLREGDGDVPQEARIEAFHVSGASVLVSVHADYESTGKLRGPFLVVHPPDRHEESSPLPLKGAHPLLRFHASLRLARALADALGVSPALSKWSVSEIPGVEFHAEGSVVAAPHRALRDVAGPAVVLIPFLLSSSEDRKLAASAEEVDLRAEAVARGIAVFFSEGGREP